MLALAAAVFAGLLSVGGSSSAAPAARRTHSSGHRAIRRVVEIMLENHTFDSLFGGLAGADSIPKGTTLRRPNGSRHSAARVAPLVAGPNQGSVGPALSNNRQAELMAMDRRPDGRFAMDHYTSVPADGLASITTFSPSADPDLQFLARHYALAEHNFQPEVGDTGPNVTAAVNGETPGARQHFHTIFDELQSAGRSWKIFYGVPRALLRGSIWDLYQPAGHANGLVGTDRFVADAAAGTLPDFSFVRPGFGYSQESPEDLSPGDAWLGQLVSAVMRGPDWSSTALFITYDEGGGFWDHVSPPQVDAVGYGTRTPMVVISPYTRPGLITQTTTNLSVLSFVQRLWGLAPLDRTNRLAPDLFGQFNFRRAPAAPWLPPVDPPDTLRMSEGSGSSVYYTAKPRQTITVNLIAENPGLDQDRRLNGPISLTALGPAGSHAPSVPHTLTAAGGASKFRATFPSAGYWRVLARAPDGARGWVTFAVGTGPDTP